MGAAGRVCRLWRESGECSDAGSVGGDGALLTELQQFRAYSDPKRDPRQHTISYVFTAQADGTPVAGDDAASVRQFPIDDLPSRLCFDHGQILADYKKCRNKQPRRFRRVLTT